MGIFYKEFGLKKILECEGIKSLNGVKVGTEVYLKNDLDNNKFKGLTNQVGVAEKGKPNDVIGVIPEEEGKLIKDFLDMGWNNLFKAVISQNDSTKPLENRFKVAVYIEQCDFKKTQNVDQGSSKKPDVQSDDSQGGK